MGAWLGYVGIMLTGNPRLVPELYPHMAEPVCQHCGALTDCDHLAATCGSTSSQRDLLRTRPVD